MYVWGGSSEFNRSEVKTGGRSGGVGVTVAVGEGAGVGEVMRVAGGTNAVDVMDDGEAVTSMRDRPEQEAEQIAVMMTAIIQNLLIKINLWFHHPE